MSPIACIFFQVSHNFMKHCSRSVTLSLIFSFPLSFLSFSPFLSARARCFHDIFSPSGHIYSPPPGGGGIFQNIDPWGRHKYIYHGQPYARVDLNPMPESTLSPSQGLWIWPLVWEQATTFTPPLNPLVYCTTTSSLVSSNWRRFHYVLIYFYTF